MSPARDIRLVEGGPPSCPTNITIGRYDGCGQTSPGGVETPLTDTWSGWIEGDSDGKSWIMYLGGAGRPALYWPERTDSGAVVGEPVRL